MNKPLHRTIPLIGLTALLVATALPLGAANFLYTWDASPDADLGGYRVYQSAENSDYELLAEIDEPDLQDPVHPSYLVTGLTDGTTYRFAASTVSASGMEGDLSNQTCVTVNGQVVQCQDSNQSGTTVFISCFIDAAGHNVGTGHWKTVKSGNR
jgi:fibronectin type 3 domain-containing protein